MKLMNRSLLNFCRISKNYKSYSSFLISCFAGKLLLFNVMAKWSYYAVARGKKVGIYTNWNTCKMQVDGFKGAKYKGFNSKEDAEKFVSSNGSIKDNYESNCSSDTSNFKNLTSRKEKRDKANLKRSLDAEEEITNHSNKRTKSAPLSTERTINEKGFSINKEGYYEVYTDGACTKNGRKGAKAGLGVFWSNVDGSHAESLNLSEPVIGHRATNNVGEIQAITRCVQQAIDEGIYRLLVYSDSQFTINCVEDWMPKWKRNGWKKADGEDVINKIELEDLDSRLKEAQSLSMLVKFQHIRGHHGIFGNEMADRLAVAGAKKYIQNSVI